MELRDYINVIKKRMWIILVLVPVFIIVTLLVDIFILKNIYEADATLYVGRKYDQKTTIMYDDLLISQLLVKDYREIMKSRLVSEKVVDELKKKGKLEINFNPLTLKDKIDVNLRNDTKIIEIKARDSNPQKAKDLTNEFAEVFKIKIKELMKVDNIEIIDWARFPNSPTKPEKKKDVILAGFVGLLTSLCSIFLFEYLDNTIKTSEDVEKYLELPVLGTIPKMKSIKGGKE